MRRRGVTLVELLVSTAVIALLSAFLVAALGQVGSLWRRSAGKSEQFREAQNAFESMTTRLAQATLDVHWEYDDPAAPTKYRRDSNLRFISGPAQHILESPPGGSAWPTHAVFFQAPFGVSENPDYREYANLLCSWGYFLQVSDDRAFRPPFLPEASVPVRHRPRLMEMWDPAEKNLIYKFTGGTAGRSYAGREWFRLPLARPAPPVRVIAENILALIIVPRLAPADEALAKHSIGASNADYSPLAPAYLYDSAPLSATNRGDRRHTDARLNPVHQLPPILQVSMVAADETSVAALGYGDRNLDPLTLGGKFRRSEDFSRDLSLAGGSDAVESRLISARANYRIFTTNVVIRGAKWSREQTEVVTP
jgi:uncharacterized protein (TIGR02599 family)